MPLVLTWTDNNSDEEGHRVYRSTAPMDVDNLPLPLADLGPDVERYEDASAVEGETYYYRVSAYLGASEVVSEEKRVDIDDLRVQLVGAGPHGYGDAGDLDKADSLTLTLPAELLVGDLLLAGVFARRPIVPPTGWSLVRATDSFSTSDVVQTTYLYSRLASPIDTTGSTEHTWTATDTDRIQGQILGFRGARQLAASNDQQYVATDGEGEDGILTGPVVNVQGVGQIGLTVTSWIVAGVDPATAVSVVGLPWVQTSRVSMSEEGVVPRLSLAYLPYTEQRASACVTDLERTVSSQAYGAVSALIGRAP